MNKEDRFRHVTNKILKTFKEEQCDVEECLGTIIALLLTASVNLKISKPHLLARISELYEEASECIEEVNKHEMD